MIVFFKVHICMYNITPLYTRLPGYSLSKKISQHLLPLPSCTCAHTTASFIACLFFLEEQTEHRTG
jgi:hypothetical protein